MKKQLRPAQLLLSLFLTSLLLASLMMSNLQAQPTDSTLYNEVSQQAVLSPAPDLRGQGIKWIDFKSIPDIHNGVAYSVVDNNFNYLSTLDIASWDALTLEAGYAGRAENTGDKAVIALSINLIDLHNVIKFPILKNLELRPSIWVGFGNLGNWNNVETDWGIGVTALKIKF